MRLSVLQKEGMPFKSLVIISTNGVHVFLYYNREHIGVCGESENTEWKKKITRFWLTETEDVKSISSVFPFCSAENNNFFIFFHALCCEILFGLPESLSLEYYRCSTEERATSFPYKGEHFCMFNIHACRNHVVIIQASAVHNIPQESSIKQFMFPKRSQVHYLRRYVWLCLCGSTEVIGKSDKLITSLLSSILNEILVAFFSRRSITHIAVYGFCSLFRSMALFSTHFCHNFRP